MKTLAIAFLLFRFFSFSQTEFKIDSVGIDDTEVLNQNEVNYTKHLLTYLYADSVIDITNKKILFLTGTYGHIKVSKSIFFNRHCKPWTVKQDYPNFSVIELTEDEVSEIGYELIFVAWSKIAPEGKARKKFIKNAEVLKDT